MIPFFGLPPFVALTLTSPTTTPLVLLDPVAAIPLPVAAADVGDDVDAIDVGCVDIDTDIFED